MQGPERQVPPAPEYSDRQRRREHHGELGTEDRAVAEIVVGTVPDVLHEQGRGAEEKDPAANVHPLAKQSLKVGCLEVA